MTPEQLKASILQYAILGKLVEQRPEEGTAEELYQQIQAEKQQLIKDGKIKKEKPLAEITEDEIPFDIPENWKWVRLSTIGITQTGTTPPKSQPQYFGSDIPFLGPKDIQNGMVDYENQSLSNEGKKYGRVTPAKSIIQVCIGGSIGKCALVNREVTFNQQINSIYPLLANSEYIYHVLDSYYFKKNMKDNAGGTATPIINRGLWEAIAIPLPPLKEQHRIVAKIDELLPFVERYAASYAELEKLNAKFPEEMKKSILQYAIQGKLVEQRPEEGTAEELYQQIQAEKQQLIKEGKIKKEKPLAAITEEEIPFDIPDSWKWVRVGALFNHNTGKAMNSSAKKIAKEGSIRKFITTSNVYWNRLELTNVKEMFFSNDELERCTVTKGDLLMCEGGAYFGRTAIWNFDYDICFQNHVHRLRYYKELDLMYFYYVFYFYRNTNMMKSKGTAMPGLSSVTLHEMVVPLPPLAEQHRIVQKINQLLPYCDQLIK